MDTIIEYILSFSGTFFTVLTVLFIYFVTKTIFDRQSKGKKDTSLVRTIILFGILLVGVIAIILALPMNDSLRGQITSLIGIVISAVLALSSATFIGNGLAGIMLRSINSFRPGDFIHVNDLFGRITERGLFHTEIQTENRDLMTIPNLYLATNPVKVTRSSGTLISGVVSLGYDVNRQKIEKVLLDAANRAELKDPFVRITELGDFSVVYKVYGLVEEIKTFLSAQSRLNAMMLDALHEANIEIVSPNFMNQRQVGESIFIPQKVKKHEEVGKNSGAPESIIFDKAEEAESLEQRKLKMVELSEKIKTAKDALKTAPETDKESLQAKINKLENLKDRLAERIDNKIDEISGNK